MVGIRRRVIKDILILLLLILLCLYHFLLSLSQQISPSPHYFPQLNGTKFYFESDDSFEHRLKLQDKIKYGSHLKRLADKVFLQREGYNEPFLDSLPIFRDESRDFRPPMCHQNPTSSHYISSSKVSVIMNYHNELLSLLLRSVYTVLVSIPSHNLHELILIDDGSDLTAYQVSYYNFI